MHRIGNYYVDHTKIQAFGPVTETPDGVAIRLVLEGGTVVVTFRGATEAHAAHTQLVAEFGQ